MTSFRRDTYNCTSNGMEDSILYFRLDPRDDSAVTKACLKYPFSRRGACNCLSSAILVIRLPLHSQ